MTSLPVAPATATVTLGSVPSSLMYHMFDSNWGMVTPRRLRQSPLFLRTLADVRAVLQICGDVVSTFRGP